MKIFVEYLFEAYKMKPRVSREHRMKYILEFFIDFKF